MVRGGDLIKVARKARGMSQEYIADAMGDDCDVRTISRWENFKCEPKFCDVIKIITKICKLSLAEVEELTYANNLRC